MPNIFSFCKIGFNFCSALMVSPNLISATYGWTVSSNGSELGVNGFPLSSIAIRYLSHPANTSGINLRSAVFSSLDAL